jgi:hypothetical protein
MVALWLSCAAGCGGGGVPVQSPTTLSAGRSVPQTEQAILDALPKRSWTAESVQPGRIIAFLAVRAHLLRVEIRYDQQQVGIYYVDSDKLSAHVEANGQVYAHNKVNAWIRNLAQDISASLAVAPQPGTAGGAINAPNTPPPGAPLQAAPVQQ